MSSFTDLANASVGEVKQRDPILVAIEANLGVVVELMAARNRGAALVTDPEGRLIGIFTENNLIAQVDLESNWRGQSVADYMTAKVETVTRDTSITTALLKMTTGRFRHLPVVDAGGVPVAIVSIRDIISHIAHCSPKDFVNLPPSPGHEATEPYGG